MSSLLEIKRIVKQNKDLLDIISNYFDSNGINAQQKLFNYIEMYAIDRRASDFRKFIHIFYRFGMYYTRKPDFVTKIEQIFVYYKNTIKQFFKNKELFEFIRNRLMLLIMIQNEIIELNESIINLILTQKDSVFQKSLYFYPEIKPFISEEQRTKIENDLLQIDPEILTKFDEKRKIGENDGYLYSLIRKDSLKEFVICMHSNEIKATSIVKPSLFESNSFLYHYDNQTTLIEYAAYFGSTKIFIYLFKKYAIRPKLLWDYATHGRNPQIIHFLEDNEILKDFTYQSCMENAMKFYHNDIANYILNNLLQDTIEDKYKYKKNIVCYAFHYLNFAFLSDDLSEKWVLHYACQYNYPILVSLLLENKEININEQVIFKFLISIKFLLIENFKYNF
ncbi:hypothetical protein M9Y10_020198 [Tritrichomonas musculus]|uniref:DUF3447 domain-containing protein n=1 Tax=Tritrichomonas musculus TaxID=1915356 RepID=A0ABR2HFI7_9EUKA